MFELINNSSSLFLHFLLSFGFDWEDISNIQECLNTFPRTSVFVKNTALRFVFSTLFSAFENVLSCVIYYLHVLSCVIYYFKTD